MAMTPTATDALSQEILELKEKLNAVILVHNYQVPEIQDIGDFVGDSLGLSQQAAETDADVIVFCGVHFMAETAKILSPKKTVVLPDRDAGCSLEESCPPEQLAKIALVALAQLGYRAASGVHALSQHLVGVGPAIVGKTLGIVGAGGEDQGG